MSREVLAEGLGTALLLFVIVGSALRLRPRHPTPASVPGFLAAQVAAGLLAALAAVVLCPDRAKRETAI